MRLTITPLLKHHVQDLAHAGTLDMLRHAAPDLDNEQFQVAYVEIFKLLAGLMLKLLDLEAQDRPLPAAEPSRN